MLLSLIHNHHTILQILYFDLDMNTYREFIDRNCNTYPVVQPRARVGYEQFTGWPNSETGVKDPGILVRTTGGKFLSPHPV